MKNVLKPILLHVLMICFSTTGFAQNDRIIKNFNKDWWFKREITPWVFTYKHNAGEPTYKKVNIPHDWSIEGPFDQMAETQGFGAFLPAGSGVYQKTFFLPDSIAGKKINIEFDGVYQNSEVYCNGVWLGKRPFGYIGFTYDLTPYVRYGAFENKITVLVDNSDQINSRWYSGSGITREVRLVITDKIHVPQWGTYITTPEISDKKAKVLVETTIENEYRDDRTATIKTIIYDTQNKLVATSSDEILLKSMEQSVITIDLTIDDPRLWCIDDPYLYRIEKQIFHKGKLIDSYPTTLGIREIEYHTDKGFLLNGNQVIMKGVCLHHDGGSVGAAVPIEIWERRLRILKNMGCNAVRTSHNPFDPAFYDLCNRMGFLVMDEVFDEWELWTLPMVQRGYNQVWQEWWKKDLTDFIKRDRNHPSVVIYSVGNEIIEQNRPRGIDLAKEIVELSHQIDNTRPVTNGQNMMDEANINGFSQVFDVVGYNYGIQFDVYEPDRKAYPERKFIGTESTRSRSTRGEYVFPFDYGQKIYNTKEGYFSSYDFIHRRYGQEKEWEVTQDNDYISGMFIWTGIDYLGESKWPLISAEFGAIDRCGFPKDAFYFYQSQWTDEPMVHVLPHWNWEEGLGSKVPVWVYTNCDSVSLTLNQKKLGTKSFADTPNLHLDWNVEYEPGELKAIGYRNGRSVAIDMVQTTGDFSQFKLELDTTDLIESKNGVYHLIISGLDKKDRLVPTSDEPFEIMIKGPALLRGLDNGDPLFKGDFRSTKGKLFNGLALAILERTESEGEVKILIRDQKGHNEEIILAK